MNATKQDIRKEILKKRSEISLETRLQWNEEIYNKLIISDFYKTSATIFSFVSFKDEVDTHKFIMQALKDGKTICVPKVASKKEGMKTYKINSFEDLKEGYFGILEPKINCSEIYSHEIDFILMPGVAFDNCGGRVGYGAGFYDRFLSNMKKDVPKIAIAYDFQFIDKVPTDELDVQIDGIITNSQIKIF